MSRPWPLLLALATVVVGPILLRPRGDDALLKGDEELIVISPHNEAVRAEFGRGFREWYHARTGRTVKVDFRTPGGTSEIKRFIQGKYAAGFKNEWTRKPGREWSGEVERGFMNAKLVPDETPADDTPAEAARRAWLASTVTCDHDVFFGGGAIDFIGMADEGMLADSGFVAANPDLFADTAIPRQLGGEQYWDAKGRWIGTTIGAFGIAFNRDQLARLGMPEPQRWSDLGDPRFFRALALANPTQSSSANKAFEMLIQQQMNESPSVEEGWARAMRLLQRIGANARYWSDFSSKIALDVEAGEAAAGMTIDFYGRYQAASVRRADGTSRIGYNDAAGGTSFGADPVAMLRGAPHPELAKQFIAFLLAPEGQKLWAWKAGTPGGPRVNTQHRFPILPSLYAQEFHQFRCNADTNPYELAKSFTYRGERTGRLFDAFRFTIRVMCIDTHSELTAAWGALIRARRADGSFPPEALAAFHDVSAVDYTAAQKTIQPANARDAKKITQVQLAKSLADTFRGNYRRAAELARQGK
jgi:iron(III) transport system substrate-binding protein